MSGRELADFEAVFRAHYGALCMLVNGYVRSPSVAEELVQDVFVRLWELQGATPARALAVPYLYAAARNRALSHLRRERVARRWTETHAWAEPVAEEPLPSDAVHDADLRAAVARAVDALPARARLIFLMSRQHGLRYAEIASALGISVNTVETQMSRTLRVLRARLRPYLGAGFALVVGGIDAAMRHMGHVVPPPGP